MLRCAVIAVIVWQILGVPVRENTDNPICNINTSPHTQHSIAIPQHTITSHITPFLPAFVGDNNGFVADDEARKVRVMLEDSVKMGVACLDARVRETVPTLEGGDLGMFLLAMQAVENIRGSSVTQIEMEASLIQYITHYKNEFVICAAQEALERLCQTSHVCLTGDLLTSPPSEITSQLEELLTQSPHIGDDLLRMIVSSPDAFSSIRNGLAHSAIRSLFRIVWGTTTLPISTQSRDIITSHVRVITSHGERVDSGIVDVISSEHCDKTSPEPAVPILVVTPSYNGQNLRFRYPQILRALIDHLALFVVEAKMVTSQHITSFLASGQDITRCVVGTKDLTSDTLCYFPFVYEGVVYNDCAPSDKSPNGWCATSRAWSESTWGICQPNTHICDKSKTATLTQEELVRYEAQVVSHHIQTISRNIFSEFLRQLHDETYPSTDTRAYPHYDVILSDQCCPAAPHHMPQIKVTFESPPPMEDSITPLVCNPSSISVAVDTGLGVPSHYAIDSVTQSQIRQVFGLDSMRPMLFVSTHTHTLMSMDGRQSGVELCVPGGSIGEFTAGLAALETLSDTFTQTEVTGILTRFLQVTTQSRFTLTIDEHSLVQLLTLAMGENLPRAISSISSLTAENRIAYLLSIVTDPPPTIQNTLLALLTSPQFISDRYLHFISTIDQPKDSSTPEIENEQSRMRRLTPMVLHAFFAVMWEGRTGDQRVTDEVVLPDLYRVTARKKLDLVVVRGIPYERAVVQITQKSQRCQQDLSPLVPSMVVLGDASVGMWIWHRDAANAFRQSLSSFLIDSLSLKLVTPLQLRGRVADIVDLSAERFLKIQARRYPVYHVEFGDSCCPKVSN